VEKTGSIGGVIRDTQGVSLGGVDIVVSGKTATSGSNGVFTISGIEIGQIVLSAIKD
jgi:hypothetical protein